jgi:hypothetical protein
VICVNNATEGLQLFRNELRKFSQYYKPRIEQLRHEYSENPLNQAPPRLDDLLEAHGRKYLIDRLLLSLNWNIVLEDDAEATNLVPEAPIGSVGHGTTRYLDYFGFEHETDQALLIVEAKRPGSPLPRLKNKPARKSETLPNLDVAEAILAGLKGEQLLYEWGEWLDTLKDYFQRVQQRADSPPRRVVITDGDWCIIFREPETTLLYPSRSICDHISVYLPSGSSEIGAVFESNFNEIFGCLEYRCLARQIRSLTIGELNFHVPPGARTTMIRALHLKYNELENLYYAASPRIEVSPLLFLRVEGREWLRIEARAPEDVPTSEEKLIDHIDSVRAKAEQLTDAVKERLQVEPTWLSIDDHFADQASFNLLRGVSESRTNEFVLITGKETHFLRKQPTVKACPFHDWQKIRVISERRPTDAPLSAPSTDQRAFFPTPGSHHCAHQHVYMAKSSQITEANRLDCGPRSGENHAAFCEIFPFERHLCCRTCVFEEVCTKASAFHLPCTR